MCKVSGSESEGHYLGANNEAATDHPVAGTRGCGADADQFMIPLLSAIKSGCTLVAVTFAGGGIIAVLGDAIGDDTTVKLGLMGTIMLGVFYAGVTFRGMKDEIKEIKSAILKIEERAEKDRAHHAQLCPFVTGCAGRPEQKKD